MVVAVTMPFSGPVCCSGVVRWELAEAGVGGRVLGRVEWDGRGGRCRFVALVDGELVRECVTLDRAKAMLCHCVACEVGAGMRAGDYSLWACDPGRAQRRDPTGRSLDGWKGRRLLRKRSPRGSFPAGPSPPRRAVGRSPHPRFPGRQLGGPGQHPHHDQPAAGLFSRPDARRCINTCRRRSSC